MRKEKTLSISLNLEVIAAHYDVFCYLNSNSKAKTSFYAIGVLEDFSVKNNQTFKSLKEFHSKHKDWLFGYFPYDLKNEIEPSLKSCNRDFIEMDGLHFFVPRLVIEVSDTLKVHYHYEHDVDELVEVLQHTVNTVWNVDDEVVLTPRITKDEYVASIEKVKEHIQLGDIYEMNFCYEFFAEKCRINPVKKYDKLNRISRAPFSVFYKNKHQYILSASPERFLKKEGDSITSQPIKGTAKRGGTPNEDAVIKDTLQNDPKERAENIMIVDLVRNDLSRTAKKGSVHVSELCKVYTFDTVHQMISTVTSKMSEESNPFEVIKYAFPMGSMTGAPKVEAMKIIEQLETTKRGVYSGAIGYFTPNGDFDFNVVIRTILYNEQKKRISCMVGGAITLKSSAENEYQETLIKVNALKKALL